MKWPLSLRTFSLRSLIVVMTLCGIGLAIYVSPWAEHRRQLRRLELVEELASREPGMWSLTGNWDNYGNVSLWLSRDRGKVSRELVQAIVQARLITGVLLLEELPDEDSKNLWAQTFHEDFMPLLWTRNEGMPVPRDTRTNVDLPTGTNMF